MLILGIMHAIGQIYAYLCLIVFALIILSFLFYFMFFYFIFRNQRTCLHECLWDRMWTDKEPKCGSGERTKAGGLFVKVRPPEDQNPTKGKQRVIWEPLMTQHMMHMTLLDSCGNARCWCWSQHVNPTDRCRIQKLRASTDPWTSERKPLP